MGLVSIFTMAHFNSKLGTRSLCFEQYEGCSTELIFYGILFLVKYFCGHFYKQMKTTLFLKTDASRDNTWKLYQHIG